QKTNEARACDQQEANPPEPSPCSGAFRDIHPLRVSLIPRVLGRVDRGSNQTANQSSGKQDFQPKPDGKEVDQASQHKIIPFIACHLLEQEEQQESGHPCQDQKTGGKESATAESFNPSEEFLHRCDLLSRAGPQSVSLAILDRAVLLDH